MLKRRIVKVRVGNELALIDFRYGSYGSITVIVKSGGVKATTTCSKGKEMIRAVELVNRIHHKFDTNLKNSIH